MVIIQRPPYSHSPLQAIAFKTILQNGMISLPSEYSHQWEGKIIRVIVLDDMESTSPSLEPNPLKGSVLFEDDLISPIDERWEADQ
ncbi:hypothetical protein [Laspinema olomoucense]|uniref:hypothetical protein n=1 Tax=Laspinema olomoucense TaxID=3231600 RepID=UPI0021BAFDD0|nr:MULTISPECIES: hypothetical protein [unclassified Laspinema]MCT7988061.1 hypothetical protein [Laspinema sp. D3a]MCT7995144.1 hypothetical protein [Laspinema sp. D3c]